MAQRAGSCPCGKPVQAMQLCDDDGFVRRGAMHHSTDYPCTGSAHFGGLHLDCTNDVHTVVPGEPMADAIYTERQLRSVDLFGHMVDTMETELSDPDPKVVDVPLGPQTAATDGTV